MATFTNLPEELYRLQREPSSTYYFASKIFREKRLYVKYVLKAIDSATHANSSGNSIPDQAVYHKLLCLLKWSKIEPYLDGEKMGGPFVSLLGSKGTYVFQLTHDGIIIWPRIFLKQLMFT